ncbi:MAG: DNA translocase FtsK 4TM domain-containing protein, partial [Acidobacteriia bacterium]|nr:DNA translocase FtsK 4TM domain-containing protein [Terriglobia bacterium]
MKLLSPTPYKRLNEVSGFLILAVGLVTLLSLISYHAQDPSWDTASGSRPLNLVGYPGSYLSDLLLQGFGAVAFLFPLLMFALAWKWIRSDELDSGAVKLIGFALLALSLGTALSYLPWRLFSGTVRVSGALGYALSRFLLNSLNVAGAILATASGFIVAVYLVSSFSLAKLTMWFAAPAAWLDSQTEMWGQWLAGMHQRSVQRAAEKASQRRKREANPPVPG